MKGTVGLIIKSCFAMCLYFVLTVQVYGAENKNKHR